MQRQLFLLLVLAAALAAPAAAQPPWAQPEDPWTRLSAELDADGDGVVTRQEFDQGTSRFPHLDADGDGVLTAADFTEEVFQARHAAAIAVRPADADHDHTVTAEEWQARLAAVDPDGDGVIDPADLAPSHRRGPRGPRGEDSEERLIELLDRDGSGAIEISDLEAIFADLDADGDGALSSAELPALHGRHGRHGRHGGPGGFGRGVASGS